MPPPRHCPRPRGREQTTDKAPAVTGIHVCESGVIACESGVIASAVRRRRGSWRLHRCRPAREGLGGTALAIREGPRPRQCSARLRRQLHHTGPRRLRLYARKGRGGAEVLLLHKIKTPNSVTNHGEHYLWLKLRKIDSILIQPNQIRKTGRSYQEFETQKLWLTPFQAIIIHSSSPNGES